MSIPQPGTSQADDGVPSYYWPPFPIAPPGVTVIAFKEFKPSGIMISMDEDEMEVDGEGIPTVQLNVKHDLDKPPKPKKKSRVKKNITGEDILKRYVWYEEWEEGEALRNTLQVNVMDPLEQRMADAAEEFYKGRTWPPVASRVFEWFDKFRLFSGIIGGTTRPFIRKFRDEDEPVLEEDSDEAEFMPKPTQPTPLKVTESEETKQKLENDSVFSETKEEYERRIMKMFEAKERRSEQFFINPEHSMKVFFSSYFRDSGMMWASIAHRDAPLVVEFFFRFLIRNRAFPEKRREMEAALKVIQQAKVELPQTNKIGLAMPDEFAASMKEVFGSRLRKSWAWTHTRSDEDNADEPQTKKAKTDDDKDVNAEVVPNALEPTAMLQDVIPDSKNTAKIEEVTDDDTKPVASDGDCWGTWGASTGVSWGMDASNSESAKVIPIDSSDDIWNMPPSFDGWEAPVHSLMKLMGPTTLPLEYMISYVEESTRHIVSVEAPSPKASQDLSQFAKVILAPHSKFLTWPRAAIQKPDILEDPFSTKGGEAPDSNAEEKLDIPRHNPFKDQITILLEPKAAETLVPRMSIGGTFVQVVPFIHRGKQSGSLGGSRGRGRGGGRRASRSPTEQTFWYIEKVTQILPSFWQESATR